MTPDITLRTATAADFDPIIAVVDDWWGRPIRQALPRVFLDHFHATSTIAEADGALAGFLIGFLSPSQPDAAYIHFVGVDPARRGNGLARILYERFFALAAADDRRWSARSPPPGTPGRSPSTPRWASLSPTRSPTTTAIPPPRSSSNAACSGQPRAIVVSRG